MVEVPLLPEDEARWTAEAERAGVSLAALMVQAMRARDAAALPSDTARRKAARARITRDVERACAEMRGKVEPLHPVSWAAEAVSMDAGWP